MSTNVAAQVSPQLAVSQITDKYALANFKNLSDYFKDQNQLLNFKFFDLVFPAAVYNKKIPHGLKYIPRDIVMLNVAGGTSVIQFNNGLFDSTNMDITCTGPIHVRFFVGSYWNSNYNSSVAPADYMQFCSNVGIKTTITNPASTSTSGSSSSTSTSTTTSSTTVTKPNIQTFSVGAGTYIPTPGILYARVKMIGGGGGGKGNSASGANGTASTFAAGAVVLYSAGGGVAPTTLVGGVGGSNLITLGTYAGFVTIVTLQGCGGGTAPNLANAAGGTGGTGIFGMGAGIAGTATSGNGFVGATNTGAGGGGCGGTGAVSSMPGGGGGGYIEFIVSAAGLAVQSSWNLVIGSGGAGGTGTPSGAAGGSGVVIIEEYFQ